MPRVGPSHNNNNNNNLRFETLVFPGTEGLLDTRLNRLCHGINTFAKRVIYFESVLG